MSAEERVPPHLGFGGPAWYRIVVEGILDDGWSPRLAAMKIKVTHQEERASYTTLFGPVSDQASLQGVLSVLYDLHMSIILVAQVDADQVNERSDPEA